MSDNNNDTSSSVENDVKPAESETTKKEKKKKDKEEIKTLTKHGKLTKKFYNKSLSDLQSELVKMQYFVKEQGFKILIIFEGRDAAGKGGVIKRISEPLNPRGCRIVALEKPSDREQTQWYFQRYVHHLPGAGEIVMFDRSWYNRAGVEHVMGFCTKEEYYEFMRTCPEFERMLVRSGIILLKYWFSVSDEEQERRLYDRTIKPSKRWKFSAMDLKSWNMWQEFSKAKDNMFKYTDIKQSPWYVVEADDKKKARLNCISHILSQIPYQDVIPGEIELPPRTIEEDYIRPPLSDFSFIEEKY